MLAGILVVFFAIFLFSVAAGVAFQVGVAVPSYAVAVAFMFFLLPFLIILMIAAMARSFARGHRHGMGWDRHRMFEEWHREAHAGGAGKAES